MRDIALSLAVFGLIPFILSRPYVGILTWSWLGYMNPHRLAYGFAYDFPFVQIVAILTIVAAIFSKDQKSIPLMPVTVLLVLFIVWQTITTVFAYYPGAAFDQWFTVIKIQMMIVVTLMLMKDKARVHWLVWVIALSIGFYGIKGGLFAISTGGQHRIIGPGNTMIGGNNELAFALCIVLPLFRYLQLTLEQWWARWAVGGGMFLIALSILSSYSRGALLAGSAMLLMLLLKSRKKLTLGLALVLVVPALVSFMPDKWMDRMETIRTYEQDNSAQGRINSWKFAYNVAQERPVTGGGYGVFDEELFLIYAPDPEDYHDSHSIYFEVLGEHGFVGLGLYLMLIIASFRLGTWVIKRTKNRDDQRWAHDLAAMIQVSFVGYLVGGLFVGLAYFDLFYHLIAILVILKYLVLREEEQLRSEADDGVGGAAPAAHEQVRTGR